MTKPEIVLKIACYCGCVKEGHNNLKDCFIRSDQRGLILSPHRLTFKIFVLEAQKVEEMVNKDIPLKEIRQQIDQEFQGEGAPTETPLIE